MKFVMVQMDEITHQKMKVRCAKLNVRISDYFNDLLKRDLDADLCSKK
jgi:hypothetical protein